MAADFKTIPTLSFAAGLNEKTKPQFLTDLRAALLDVGFLYLKDTGLPTSSAGSGTTASSSRSG